MGDLVDSEQAAAPSSLDQQRANLALAEKSAEETLALRDAESRRLNRRRTKLSEEIATTHESLDNAAEAEQAGIRARLVKLGRAFRQIDELAEAASQELEEAKKTHESAMGTLNALLRSVGAPLPQPAIQSGNVRKDQRRKRLELGRCVLAQREVQLDIMVEEAFYLRASLAALQAQCACLDLKFGPRLQNGLRRRAHGIEKCLDLMREWSIHPFELMTAPSSSTADMATEEIAGTGEDSQRFLDAREILASRTQEVESSDSRFHTLRALLKDLRQHEAQIRSSMSRTWHSKDPIFVGPAAKPEYWRAKAVRTANKLLKLGHIGLEDLAIVETDGGVADDKQFP